MPPKGSRTAGRAVPKQDAKEQGSGAVQDDDLESPNSTPANVPTETPAPTPVRSHPPASLAGPPEGAMAGRGRGRGTTASSRFKPKNVRRDQGEREQMAEAERRRLQEVNDRLEKERQAEVRKKSRLQPKKRGSIMGSGMVNDRERERQRLMASGPFAMSAPSGRSIHTLHAFLTSL